MLEKSNSLMWIYHRPSSLHGAKPWPRYLALWRWPLITADICKLYLERITFGLDWWFEEKDGHLFSPIMALHFSVARNWSIICFLPYNLNNCLPVIWICMSQHQTVWLYMNFEEFQFDLVCVFIYPMAILNSRLIEFAVGYLGVRR